MKAISECAQVGWSGVEKIRVLLVEGLADADYRRQYALHSTDRANRTLSEIGRIAREHKE